MRTRHLLVAILTLSAVAGCSQPAPHQVPAGSFAFAVFGDGPYTPQEQRRFSRVLEEVSRADVQWLLHVGDILWYPCSDAAFTNRLRDMNSIDHAVIYTPGDNEWTDCHQQRPGGYDPLDRLASLRRIFFSHPGRSLGRRPMALESQANDSAERQRRPRVREFHETRNLRVAGHRMDPGRSRYRLREDYYLRAEVDAGVVKPAGIRRYTGRDSSADGQYLLR